MSEYEATYELSNEMMFLVELVIKKLRDESFDSYLAQRKKLTYSNIDDYFKTLKNPNLSQDLQKIEDDRVNLFSKLTSQDFSILDKLVLSIIDDLLFNLLREFDETDSNSFDVFIKSKSLETLRKELIGNGNFTGDFFTWTERFSKFGEIQF